MKPDQERVKNLLVDTVTLLCKNGLNFRKELQVQGVLGITLDNDNVFIVHINETIVSGNDDVDDATSFSQDGGGSSIKDAIVRLTSPGINEKTDGFSQNCVVVEDKKTLVENSSGRLEQTIAEEEEQEAEFECTIVKVEKIEDTIAEEPVGAYDEMVDFSSFLPDFSSAVRYSSELPNARHGVERPLRGLAPNVAETYGYGGEQRHVLGNEISASGGGRVSASSFRVGRNRHSSSSAKSSLSKKPEFLQQQSGSGAGDEYPGGAVASASNYFSLGINCVDPALESFGSRSQQPRLQWQRRSRHSREKPFGCTVPGCGRTYWNQAHLCRHRVKKHGIYVQAPADRAVKRRHALRK